MENWLNENTFIISDTHFGDSASVANGFENYIINNWNKAVSENDTVLHLGDFTSDDDMFNMERKIDKYAKLLNGRIFLIRGNHDSTPAEVYEKAGIKVINEYPGGHAAAVNAIFSGRKVLFSHYPVKDIYSILHPFKYYVQDYGYVEAPDGNPFELATKYIWDIFTKNKFDLNIHGHIHEKTALFDNLINVSLDNIGYKPVRVGEVLPSITHQDKK